ncbi:hypothetical protein [Sutcliffiella cohnii]|uniref:RNA polymerase sigma factor n=1 Tax=Sutcliffiella cohnii TaxID=33932 RepID=UPI002E1C7E4F|nr:hypothetical protein [Sutcliffiella cohnii]
MNIQSILEGNKDSFEEILEDYGSRLYQSALLLGYDKEESENVVANTFIYIYESLKNYNQSEPFSCWISERIVTYLFEKKRPRTSTSVLHDQKHLSFVTTFQQLTTPYKKTILHYIFQEEKKEVPLEVEKALWQLINENLSSKEECMRPNLLFLYVLGNISSYERVTIDDHLEFCPFCRETREEIKKRLKIIHNYFNQAACPEMIKNKVLQQLKPYSMNKKSKRKKAIYQSIAAGSIIGIFTMFIIFQPTLEKWTTLASNYMKHGEFYNVWKEGTYTASDKEITMEITGIDITSTLSKIDFKIKTERELDATYLNNDTHMLNVYQLGLLQIQLDNEFVPIEQTSIISTSDDLKEGSIYFYLSDVSETLPEEFTIKLLPYRIGGIFGSWEIDLPIQYSKGLKEAEVFTSYETKTILDKYQIIINEFRYSEVGSELTFTVDYTEAEEERRMAKREELNYADDQGFHYQYRIVNDQGESLYPFSYMYNRMSLSSYYEPWQYYGQQTHMYHHYYYNEDAYMPTTKGKKDEDLFFLLGSIEFYDVANIEMEVPLKDGIQIPLSIKDEYIDFDYVKVEKLEANDERPERLQVSIIGQQKMKEHIAETYIFDYMWYVDYEWGENENTYLDFYWEDVDANSMSRRTTNSNIIFQVDIPINQTLPETIILKSDHSKNYYYFNDKFKIPLNK